MAHRWFVLAGKNVMVSWKHAHELFSLGRHGKSYQVCVRACRSPDEGASHGVWHVAWRVRRVCSHAKPRLTKLCEWPAYELTAKLTCDTMLAKTGRFRWRMGISSE